MGAYFASLNFASLPARMPSAIAQGILWGLMALGVYITFRLLDVADLSVDGTFATGGAVTVMLLIAGWPAWAALVAALLVGVLAGLCTGLLHTKLGIPAILAGILTQFALYSVNLRIMGMKANQTASLKTYGMFWENGGKGFLVSSRYIPQAIGIGFLLAAVLIGLLYWYFGTEQGSALRATGSNPSMSRAQGINIDRMKVIGLALSNGVVGRTYDAVSGDSGREYGPRRNRHRSGVHRHRRGILRSDLQKGLQLLGEAAVCRSRRRALLHGHDAHSLAAA